MTSGQGSDRETPSSLGWAVRLAVLVAAVLPSLGTLGAGWISDDTNILGYVHRSAPFADATGPQYELITIRFWRPLVTASWDLQEALFGTDPLPFRCLNVLCHALAAWLLAELAWTLAGGASRSGSKRGGSRFGPRFGARFGALVAGVAWAWFPEQGGTVTWVAGRVDSLTLPFFAGALLAAVRGRSLLAALLAFGACASKETAFALPGFAAVLLIARIATARRDRGPDELHASRDLTGARALLCWTAVLVSCGAAFGLRYLALGDWLGGYPTSTQPLGQAAVQAVRALWFAAGWSLVPVVLAAAAGLFAGTTQRWMLVAGLACAAGGAAPLFAFLTDGLLEAQNRRTLSFADLGLALALGAAVSAWSMGDAQASDAASRASSKPALARALVVVLVVAALGLRAWFAWADTHEWARAGEVASAAYERATREARASVDPSTDAPAPTDPREQGEQREQRLPLLAGLLPAHHEGAYALAWGTADRGRAPFPRSARPVWPARPIWPRAEDRRDLDGLERIGASFLARRPAPEDPLRVRPDGFGPSFDSAAAHLRVDERVLSGAPDRSDALRFELGPELRDHRIELVLFTELGYQIFPWDASQTRVSLMQAFLASNGNVTMSDAFLLAAQVGARAAYLEVRAVPGDGDKPVVRSGWVPLTWDPEALDLVR